MIFAEILTSPEGKTLEFKRDNSALKEIMRTIVAFDNTAGGDIVIGRDNNGNIIGRKTDVPIFLRLVKPENTL